MKLNEMKGLIEDFEEDVREAYDRGYEEAYADCKARNQAMPTSDIVAIIANSIGEYAIEAHENCELNTEEFIAVAEVSVALWEVAKKLK